MTVRPGPGRARAGRVAVVGATGCVGRHVCAAFAGGGSEVVGVARRYAPHVGAHRFVPLDAAGCSPEQLAEFLAAEAVDAVVNATLGWGEELHRVNVELVERLIGALRLLPAARRPRLVQLGTVHEYGPVPQGTPVTELTPPAPVTEYARAKLAASRAVLGAAGIDAVVLRMANTIGPHPAPGSFLGSLAARFTEAAASPGERIELTVAAGARRDYVDVRDAADAVVRAAFAGHLGPDQRLFNIGTGTARGIDTLVLALAQACGLPASALALRTGEVAAQGASTGTDFTCLDASRARAVLGWSPRRSPAESMRAMAETARATCFATS
ncbi:NAD-dependent epimerase/dehydratase family protein [Streptomyces pristinaespiralis]|uniref:NAD-dependent epimerase/dehydratase family protein n=1 Tax=Streptomyces pristinaespiralis TaxID=38300 RepID=UPI0037A88324